MFLRVYNYKDSYAYVYRDNVAKFQNGMNSLVQCCTSISSFQLLDSGAKDALSDVISKVLQRVANQPEGKEETIDNTVLV